VSSFCFFSGGEFKGEDFLFFEDLPDLDFDGLNNSYETGSALLEDLRRLSFFPFSVGEVLFEVEVSCRRLGIKLLFGRDRYKELEGKPFDTV